MNEKSLRDFQFEESARAKLIARLAVDVVEIHEGAYRNDSLMKSAAAILKIMQDNIAEWQERYATLAEKE